MIRPKIPRRCAPMLFSPHGLQSAFMVAFVEDMEVCLKFIFFTTLELSECFNIVFPNNAFGFFKEDYFFQAQNIFCFMHASHQSNKSSLKLVGLND